ncbi:MAG: hypothetical protein ACR2RV_06010, partial [Verrucomicrobiales bacterium]
MHPEAPQGIDPGAYAGMPVAVDPFIEDPKIIEHEQQRAANRSKAAALGIAVLVHALIGMLLAWIVLAVLNEEPPELIIESTGAADLPPSITKEQFTKKVSNDKPSPPSESSQVIVANIAAPVAVPMVENITDAPVIGDATNGMG